MLGGGKQGLYPLWKYCDRALGMDSGGTTTITYKLCGTSWQCPYMRVRAHFLHIPRKGVDPCLNEVERYDVVKDQ